MKTCFSRKNLQDGKLLRDPYLGPFEHLSKDLRPCMRGADHKKNDQANFWNDGIKINFFECFF